MNTFKVDLLRTERTFDRVMRFAEVDEAGAIKGVVTSLNITPYTREMNIPATALVSINEEDLQSLMNQLWTQGFRPKEIDYQKDLIKAKDTHISNLNDIFALFMKHSLYRGEEYRRPGSECIQPQRRL